MLAQTIEITTGIVAAGIFAIVGPMAVIGGMFVAWGRLRQTVDDNRIVGKELREALEKRDDRLRQELDAHARVLSDRIDAVQNHLQAAHRSALQDVRKELGSLSRWRQRVLGAATAQHVPQQTTPAIHRSSTGYPAYGIEDSDDGTGGEDR